VVPSCLSVPFGGGVVLLHHAGGDAPALADCDALVLRPGPDIAAALTACRGPRRLTSWSPACFAGVADDGGELLAQRRSVLLAQVDLILRAAEPERTVSSAGPPSRSSSSATVTR
jgi:hypothetical protein